MAPGCHPFPMNVARKRFGLPRHGPANAAAMRQKREGGHAAGLRPVRARQETAAPAWAGFTRVYWSAGVCGRAALRGRAGAPARASQHAPASRRLALVQPDQAGQNENGVFILIPK